mmetsp:Transcript_27040/g.26101  ORF Transcript_27040/g.26101 Transcript_27040/m.26101 type:complete len:252 (-) Transcript_27040:40-795(-)
MGKTPKDMVQHHFINPDNYFEKPRPNFYNVIQRLRENQTAYKRVLYVAKLNESEIKGEQESKGDSKLEKDISNYFKNLSEGAEFTGLNLLIGPWCLHLLECDSVTVMKMLTALNETAQQPNSLYSQIWIIHQTEECPDQIFSAWICKKVVIERSQKDLKSMLLDERAYTLYDSMIQIGIQLRTLTGKVNSQINEQIKRLAIETLPGQEELLACIYPDHDMTLNDYLLFFSEPPDIVLENELVWPVDPDLIY